MSALNTPMLKLHYNIYKTSNTLAWQLCIWNVCRYKWSWKLSPDWSGYAARSAGSRSAAAAFERKAGSPFL